MLFEPTLANIINVHRPAKIGQLRVEVGFIRSQNGKFLPEEELILNIFGPIKPHHLNKVVGITGSIGRYIVRAPC